MRDRNFNKLRDPECPNDDDEAPAEVSDELQALLDATDARIFPYRDDEGDLCMALGDRWVWLGAWDGDWHVIGEGYFGAMSDTEAINYLVTGEVPCE